jgi:nucleotide-binding universal stress UspA family protein
MSPALLPQIADAAVLRAQVDSEAFHSVEGMVGAVDRARVLVAIDPACPSLAVGRTVAAIACATGATVSIVGVVPSTRGWIDENGRPAWGVAHNPLRRRAITRALACSCPAAVRWPVELRAGDAVSMIVSESAEMCADLVVLGLASPCRLPGIRHQVASRVLRRIAAPVLAISESSVGQPDRVVAAVDFTAESLRAAQSVLKVMKPSGTLHLMHVRQDFAYGTSSDDRVRCGYGTNIAAAFDRLLTDLGPRSGVTVTTTLLEGSPVDQLNRYAASINADTIALGSGRRESPVTRLGRLPAALVAEASRSLLIAPPPRSHARQ